MTAPLQIGILGETVAEFLRRYPDVRAEIVCTDRNVDLVAGGFDLAIRAGALADSTLIARKLGTIMRVLVASPAYLRGRGTPRSPRDLDKHDAVTFGSGPSPSVWLLRSGRESVEVRVTPRLAVNDPVWVRDAACAGVGVALLPEALCRDQLQAGRLRRVLREWSSDETTPPRPLPERSARPAEGRRLRRRVDHGSEATCRKSLRHWRPQARRVPRSTVPRLTRLARSP